MDSERQSKIKLSPLHVRFAKQTPLTMPNRKSDSMSELYATNDAPKNGRYSEHKIAIVNPLLHSSTTTGFGLSSPTTTSVRPSQFPNYAFPLGIAAKTRSSASTDGSLSPPTHSSGVSSPPFPGAAAPVDLGPAPRLTLTVIRDIIQTSEYLESNSTWSSSISMEEKKKYTPKFIKRNDVIWELCKSERSYLQLLVNMNEFRVNFPPSCGSVEEIFPQWDSLMSCHAAYLEQLVAIHSSQEHNVVRQLGPTLLQALGGSRGAQMAEMYGNISTCNVRLKKKLDRLKRNPEFVSYLQTVESNRAIGRKTLIDCFTVLTQRWTKVEPQILEISVNTLNNQEEADQLEAARMEVKSILQRAEVILGRHINSRKLRRYRENFEITKAELQRGNWLQDDIEDVLRSSTVDPRYVVGREMWLTDSELILYEKIGVEFKPHAKEKEGVGVLVNDTFFILEKVPDTTRPSGIKYRLIIDDMDHENIRPFVLRLSEEKVLFRTPDHRSSEYKYYFILIFFQNTRIIRFYCSTPDARARWQRLFENGFSEYTDAPKVRAGIRLNKRLKRVKHERDEVDRVLTNVESWDNILCKYWEQRRIAFHALLNETVRLDEENGGVVGGGVIPPSNYTAEPLHSLRKLKTQNSTGLLTGQKKKLSSLSINRHSSQPLTNTGTSTSNTSASTAAARDEADSDSISIDSNTSLGTDDIDLASIAKFQSTMENMIRQICQLKFAINNGSCSLSRSTSNAERGDRSSVVLRKTETFAGVDDKCDKRISESFEESPQLSTKDTLKAKREYSRRKSFNLPFLSKKKNGHPPPLTSKAVEHPSSGGGNFLQTPPEAYHHHQLTLLHDTSASHEHYMRGSHLSEFGLGTGTGAGTGGGGHGPLSRHSSTSSSHNQLSDSCLSISTDLLIYMEKIHRTFDRVLNYTLRLQTSYAGLLRHHSFLQRDNDALKAFCNETDSVHPRPQKDIIPKDNRISGTDWIGPAVVPDLESHEKLRRAMLDFNKAKDEWNKEHKKEKANIEKGREDLLAEKLALEKEIQRHNDEKLKLQRIIDLNSQHLGVNLKEKLAAAQSMPPLSPPPVPPFPPITTTNNNNNTAAAQSGMDHYIPTIGANHPPTHNSAASSLLHYPTTPLNLSSASTSHLEMHRLRNHNAHSYMHFYQKSDSTSSLKPHQQQHHVLHSPSNKELSTMPKSQPQAVPMRPSSSLSSRPSTSSSSTMSGGGSHATLGMPMHLGKKKGK